MGCTEHERNTAGVVRGDHGLHVWPVAESGFIANQAYCEGKMLQQYAAYHPFEKSTTRSASPRMIGIWSMSMGKSYHS
jgi:hypothetical protein